MRFLCNPAPAASPSGSNNPWRIKGKTAFFSPGNICLSGLNGPLALFIALFYFILGISPDDYLDCLGSLMDFFSRFGDSLFFRLNLFC
ncbi:hypothetical protein FZC80_01040 [Rossellomorea aquimaris]|uniref:Uncharacterized protein n=1 Tax=Rossellomorea aquimaris TaxID=189382 RepID=A0A5D4U9H9_9BACI|nr:hypothetical protein FZC80_01040 [Rossellomorea aquimaris]